MAPAADVMHHMTVFSFDMLEQDIDGSLHAQVPAFFVGAGDEYEPEIEAPILSKSRVAVAAEAAVALMSDPQLAVCSW